ncbi:MAG: hypothetical protein ABWX94_00225 [Candidatus Saccharimonadales bacterium]
MPLEAPVSLPELDYTRYPNEVDHLQEAYEAYLDPELESFTRFGEVIEELTADEHGKLGALCMELDRLNILGQHPPEDDAPGRLIIKDSESEAAHGIPDRERIDLSGVSLDIVRNANYFLKLRQAKDATRVDALNKLELVDDEASDEYEAAELKALGELEDTHDEMAAHYVSILAELDFTPDDSMSVDDN